MEHPHVRDATSAEFPAAVLQRSREVPVVVDFWAAWCGPCKVLGPLLEKAAAERGGDFELVKIDVDANPDIAAQFQVQGIPTVVGFRDGRPVSRFTGAIPESSLASWLDELLPDDLDRAVEEARDAALEGDVAGAEEIFRSVLALRPDHADAGTGLASLLIARGDAEEALIVLGKLVPSAEVDRLQAAARLSTVRDDDIPALEARLSQDPGDERARLDLALSLVGRGEFEPALDHMLRLVRDKGARKDEARVAMVDVFGVLGEDHPLTRAYRRQLASALF